MLSAAAWTAIIAEGNRDGSGSLTIFASVHCPHDTDHILNVHTTQGGPVGEEVED